MPLLVTSAADANGNGYGALLAFDRDGTPLGPFSSDTRIADPRGLGVQRDEGLLFLNSGTNRVPALDPSGRLLSSWRVQDPELSPLDLAVAPNGNIVVSSEHPFGAPEAVTTVREYDATDGHLVRVFAPGDSAEFRKPRGLRFGPDGRLYGVARDEVVTFDFATGQCLGPLVTLPRLNGQALIFFP